MQVVIDIPLEWLFDMKNKKFCQTDSLYQKILNGTPLPEGHGRIGDLDALEQEMLNGIKAGNYEDGYDDYPHINNIDDCVDCVRYADAIIEADKESEE